MVISSGRINANTIASQSFANLYNLINNRSNVPDPNDTTGSRKFVFVRTPRIGRGSRLFPFIVVSRTKPVKTGTMVSLTKSFMAFDTTIRIVCRDSDSDSDGDAKGSQQCEAITDSIIKTLNSAANRKTLINQRMANLEYNIDTDEDEFEGRRVFTSEFDIRFEETLLITS